MVSQSGRRLNGQANHDQQTVLSKSFHEKCYLICAVSAINDVGLILFTEGIQNNDWTTPVVLSHMSYEPTPQVQDEDQHWECWISGSGLINENGATSEFLQVAEDLDAVDNFDEC